jgi:hypothetical protein
VAAVLGVPAQVEEDLDRATCLISDGDVASLLPSKAHGNLGYCSASSCSWALASRFLRRRQYSICNVLWGVCRCFSQDVLGPSQPAGNKEGGAAQGEGGVQ